MVRRIECHPVITLAPSDRVSSDNFIRCRIYYREDGESGRRRTRFRCEGEHHSVVNPNSIPF